MIKRNSLHIDKLYIDLFEASSEQISDWWNTDEQAAQMMTIPHLKLLILNQATPAPILFTIREELILRSKNHAEDSFTNVAITEQLILIAKHPSIISYVEELTQVEPDTIPQDWIFQLL